MINLQAELEKYREQEALCATFLARYRYDEWEALDPEVKAKETKEFLDSQKAYRIPFTYMNRKCWMKRALAVVAWGMCQEADELTDERIEAIVEEEDRFVEHLTEAFMRVFPDADRKVSNKVVSARDYYADIRRRYRREAAQNGYYAMIADAVSWGEYEGDTPIIIPARVLRLAGKVPEIVALAALFHYRKPGNGVVVQGDFNNWFDETVGKSGEQRLTDLVKKQITNRGENAYITSMRAGTEKNASSRFYVSEELQWKEGEPGIEFCDDGAHLLGTQLCSFASTVYYLVKSDLSQMTDEQIAFLAEVAKENLWTKKKPIPAEYAGEAHFCLNETQRARFEMLFAGQKKEKKSYSIEELRQMPETRRKAFFANAWEQARKEWLTPPFKKKVTDEGKCLDLKPKLSKEAWEDAICLLIHKKWFADHRIQETDPYDYMSVSMHSAEEIAEYGSDVSCEELLDHYEALVSEWAERKDCKLAFRFKWAKTIEKTNESYRFTITMKKKKKENVSNETNVASAYRGDVDGGAGSWWLQNED